MRKSVRYAVLGAALGTLAPLGWLLVRLASGALIQGGAGMELRAHAALYVFMLIGAVTASATVCSLYGGALDRMAQLHGMYEELSARLMEATAHLEQSELTDAATGLKNARFFNDWLPTECGRAMRDERPLALLVVELDQYRQLVAEDPEKADRAMAHAARAVLGQIRTTDIACRGGAESFAVMCPGAAGADAQAVAERIRAAIAGIPFIDHDVQVALTASCGVAIYPEGKTAKDFYRMADTARQIARTSGRNRVVATLGGGKSATG